MIPIHILTKEETKEIKIVELPKVAAVPVSEAHRHDFYECFLFITGGGIHTIDFVDFPILDYSIHIITPGQVHQIKRTQNSFGYVYMFDLMHFSQHKNIEDFLFDHACYDVNECAPTYHFENNLHAALDHISSRLWSDYQVSSSLKNYFITHQISLLLLYCMQQNLENHALNKHADTYTLFRRLLNTNFKTMKKVKDYALQLNVTEKVLNEIIHQRSGEKVSTLIFKQVILEAKRLLKSGVAAKEVAYLLNFSDPAHFSKFFKNQTGFSPSEFK